MQECWARAPTGTLSTPGVVFRGEPGGRARGGRCRDGRRLRRGGTGADRVTVSALTPGCIRCAPCWTAVAASVGSLVPLNGCGWWKPRYGSCSLDPVTVVPLLAPVIGVDAEHGYPCVTVVPEALRADRTAGANLSAGVLGQPWVLSRPRMCSGSIRPPWKSSARFWALPRVGCWSSITGRPGGWLPAAWPVRMFDLTALTDEQSDALIAAAPSDVDRG